MKKSIWFLTVCFFLFIMSLSAFSAASDSLDMLLGPNVPVKAIPEDLQLPDAVIPFLKGEFYNTIGKQASFDTQFKIVTLITKITNVPSQKYDLLQDIIMEDVRNANKTAQKIIAVSPDARVLAINAIGISSNSTYVPALLTVLERDESVNPRIAAAMVLPKLGNNDVIIPKMLDLLKNQYGANRAKFEEQDSKRFDDDRVAEAIIKSLGEIGDPRAFPVLLQTVMNPDRHRDDTVKAGWDAMKKIKW